MLRDNVSSFVIETMILEKPAIGIKNGVDEFKSADSGGYGFLKLNLFDVIDKDKAHPVCAIIASRKRG